MASSLQGFAAFSKFLAIAFAPGERIWLKASHDKFFAGHTSDGNFALWATTGSETERRLTQVVGRAYDYLSDFCDREEGGAFFIPGKPSEFPLTAYCHASDLISCEMDGGTTEEQWARIRDFEAGSGLKPALIIGSGGKSLHVHWKLSAAIPIVERTYLQKLCAIAMVSDPAVVSPHQPMRVPGFLRKEKGKPQLLEEWSEAQYSQVDTLQGLKQVFAARGWIFPEVLSDKRWQQLRQVLVNKITVRSFEEQKAEIQKLLALSEESFNPPKREYQRKDFIYDGSTIPLERCIARHYQDLIKSGVQAGSAGRNPEGFKLACYLMGICDFLNREGIHYNGDPYQLLEDYCRNCSPAIDSRECDRIWKQAQRYASTPHLDEDAVRKRVSYWQWEQNPDRHKSDRTSERGTISREDWEERFKLPEQIKGIANYIQGIFGRLARKFPKAQGFATRANISTPQTSSAIVLWQPPLNLISVPLQYVPGELPTPDEWVAMGRPSIEFKGRLRIPLLREAYAKNYERVWDSSFMGQGKTHDIGNLRGELFKFERDGKEVIPQIIYNAANHRNPDTATVESFADMPSRHDGLVTDKTRKTASGYSHVVRPKPDQKADIPGNCPETQTFLILNQEKGLTVRGGKGSPVCESCPLFKNEEGQITCEFLTDRWETLHTNTEIRQHLDQSSKAKADAIGIIEETSATLKPYKQLTATKQDLTHAYQELKDRGHFKLAWCVAEIRDTLYKALNGSDLPLWGFNFAEILDKLPTKERIANKIWEVYGDEWLYVKDPWTIPAPEELGKLIKNALCVNLRDYIIDDHTPEEKQAFLREQLAFDWISPVLDAIVENKAHLRIDAQGLHITRRTSRYKSVLTSYKMVVLNDSTATASDLALLTGFKKDSILEIRQERPDNRNLTITIIDGFGRLGQSRETEGEFCAQSRFEKLLADITARHKNPGIIDHQKFVTRYPVQTGYWGRDNRGSNAFINCDALVLAGDPIPNLGQTVAEYHALTGKIVNPSKWEGGFGAWVRRHIASESVQAGARLRAHLSPSAKHLYIVGNSTAVEHWRHFFPGATIQVRHITEFCPAASPKGLQREQALIEVMRDLLANGLNFTQTTLAEKLNLTRSRISQLSKAICAPIGITKNCFGYLKSLLISLIDSSLRKINTTPDLSTECRFIAETYLPDLLVGLSENVEESLGFVVRELIAVRQAYGPQTFKDILDTSEATPRLLGVLLRMFRPKDDPIAA